MKFTDMFKNVFQQNQDVVDDDQVIVDQVLSNDNFDETLISFWAGFK